MKRSWWPFEVVPEKNRTEEHQAEMDFVIKASELGCRAYMEGGDFGAVADNGRECRIAWRGNHRRELMLIDVDNTVRNEVFASRDQGSAFTKAAEVALAWLPSRPASALKAAASAPDRGAGEATPSLPIREAGPRN